MNKAQDMGRATKGCSALQSLLSWCRAERAEFYFEPFCQLCPGLKWSGPFPFHGSDEQIFGVEEQILGPDQND